jgi:NAD(P)-dependent dehydrogenase (short-subunit alcohol dehydrogenase family)
LCCFGDAVVQNPRLTHLAGHVALVTGVASGIGLATAEAFASEGGSVGLWDVSPGVVETAAGSIKKQIFLDSY